MSIVPHQWPCQMGRKCMVRCPGCPGPGKRVNLPKPTKAQMDYLRELSKAGRDYDPDTIIGG